MSRLLRALAAAAVLALACVGVLAPGRAAATSTSTASVTTVTITGHSFGARFSPSTVTIRRGATLQVHNTDSMTHTFTSIAKGSNGRPLFDVHVLAGHTQGVWIAGRLAAGRYAFHCTIHPSMTGTLVVTGGPGGIAPVPTSFKQSVVFPKVLTGPTDNLPIERAQVQVMPTGPKTTMWTYGGTYPGPTIRRTSGWNTRVTFTDDIPASVAGSTGFSVHLHGDHHTSVSDGQPTTYLIGAGQSRTYDYPLTAGGKGEPSATDFYHDHAMGQTSRDVWMGLEGMFIVDNPADKKLDLPSGAFDEPLMISDRTLDKNNQLVPVAATSESTASTGDLILVNGRYAPYQKVSTHRYRLRLVNGSNYSAYDFRLSNGQSFTQIGSGDGLFPKPVVRSGLPLGPGQRADVIVDFRPDFGRNVVLETGWGSATTPIMDFQVDRWVRDGSRVPSTLDATPVIHAPSTVSHTWTLGAGTNFSGAPAWTIDGHTFDPTAVDVVVPLGSTQRWKIVNATDEVHYVHLHEEEWHTLQRDGKAPPAYEAGLQDTWRLAPEESVEVAAVFDDYTGVFMIHCHMLDHEDDGMMAQWAVEPAGSGPPAGYHLASAASRASGSSATMTGMTGMTGMAMSAPAHVPAAHIPAAHIPAAHAATAGAAAPPTAAPAGATGVLGRVALIVGVLLAGWLGALGATRLAAAARRLRPAR